MRFARILKSTMDVNGTGGRLEKLDYRVQNCGRPSIIWMHFQNQRTGKDTRSQYKNLYNASINPEWTPIFDIKRSFTINRNKTIIRIQFPLRPAAAKTVHKAQGETLKTAVVHLGLPTKKGAFNHIHYVAMSRVTTLSKLYILSLNENNISVSPDVAEEMHRLHTENDCITHLHMNLIKKAKLSFTMPDLCMLIIHTFLMIQTF